MISRCSFAEDAEKFTKIYNARAKPLFCSLNLLFSDVPVAVAVVVFLNPHYICQRGHGTVSLPSAHAHPITWSGQSLKGALPVRLLPLLKGEVSNLQSSVWWDETGTFKKPFWNSFQFPRRLSSMETWRKMVCQPSKIFTLNTSFHIGFTVLSFVFMQNVLAPTGIRKKYHHELWCTYSKILIGVLKQWSCPSEFISSWRQSKWEIQKMT